MKLRLTTLALLGALMGLLLAPLGAAASPPAKSVAVPVTGSGSFRGTFTITQFVATADGGLAALGSISDERGVVARGVSMAVDRAASAAQTATARSAAGGAPAGSELVAAQETCTILTLVLGPLDLDLLGLRIQLNQVTLTITGQTGPGNLLGNLLCGIAGLLNPQASLADLLALLNQLAGQLNSQGLALVATALATIDGALTLEKFTKRGQQIIASGTIGGVPFSAPVDLQQTTGTCQILRLDLAPLHLELLGLVIDLSEVHLLITADPEGGLLGSLLCAIANLLNPPAPTGALTRELNRLLAAL